MISLTYESRIGELIKAKGKWFPGLAGGGIGEMLFKGTNLKLVDK